MKKLIYLFILMAAFNSCWTVNHKRFTYYKLPAQYHPSFNTNGLYYRFKEYRTVHGDDRYWAGVYFFYQDGNVLTASITMKDSSDKDIVSKLTNELYTAIENSNGDGGAYAIVGDSLKLQMFVGTQQRGVWATDIINENCIISTDDHAITLTSTICEWCPKETNKAFAKAPIEEYKFLPLTRKPDSSKLWFRKKKWYKRELENKKN
jgi:hypothetical protein